MNEWRKSSFCGSNACVRVKFQDGQVVVRDERGNLTEFDHDEWAAFVLGVQNNEFNVPD